MSTTQTFLFTDIEGSTQRWERLPTEMRRDLARHDALLREAITSAGGTVFKTVGDAFYAVFDSVDRASEAAIAIQKSLAGETWATGSLRVRIAIHTGDAEPRDNDYFGPTLNRVARILSAGHGGQVLLSSAAKSALDPSRAVLDLGERRLKDLARPERIFQLVAPGLPTDFPPLRTLDARTNRLPAQPNEFIGREAELAEVRAVLRAPKTRLLTLTGPGGTGKTRLALQVASDLLDEFEDGVFWVPLAAVRESAQVPTAIVAALGAPVTDFAGLATWSAKKQLLVVLDNFEQVVDAGRFVSQWLEAVPGLKLLVTSRARLKVTGEHDWPVASLAIAPLTAPVQTLVRSEAVQLFVARARAARPGFELTAQNAPAIAELCARLDGLPLALELAAARVRLLTPRAMLERIQAGGAVLPLLAGGASDLPGRQQALKQTIEWSYQLLAEPDRAALRAFSVFSGGANLEAATAVLGPDALERLESLSDGSLLQMQEVDGQPRFNILETVREFAHDALRSTGEERATGQRHAGYFLSFAEQLGAQFEADAQQVALAFDREHGNLRAALRWAQAEKERTLLLRLAEVLWRYWELRGHWGEARRTLGAALAAFGPEDDARCAGALLAAGALAATQGDLADAEPLLERALAAYRVLGDDSKITAALRRNAFCQAYQGRYDRAAVLLEEAQGLLLRIGSPHERVEVLNLLGWVIAEQGDIPRAVAVCREALELGERIGDPLVVIHSNNLIGELARIAGQLELGAEHYQRALSSSRTVGNRRWAASILGNLGDVRLRQGQLESACEMIRESLELNIDIGNRRNFPSLLVGVADVAEELRDLRAASRLFRVAERELGEGTLRLPLADRQVFERVKAKIDSGEPSSEREAGFDEARRTALEVALDQAAQVLARVCGPRA